MHTLISAMDTLPRPCTSTSALPGKQLLFTCSTRLNMSTKCNGLENRPVDRPEHDLVLTWFCRHSTFRRCQNGVITPRDDLNRTQVALTLVQTQFSRHMLQFVCCRRWLPPWFTCESYWSWMSGLLTKVSQVPGAAFGSLPHTTCASNSHPDAHQHTIASWTRTISQRQRMVSHAVDKQGTEYTVMIWMQHSCSCNTT